MVWKFMITETILGLTAIERDSLELIEAMAAGLPIKALRNF
jgi:hypothetical protein